MTSVPCPYCRLPSPPNAFEQCTGPDGMHFALCPECDACIPLSATENHEVLPELEAA